MSQWNQYDEEYLLMAQVSGWLERVHTMADNMTGKSLGERLFIIS